MKTLWMLLLALPFAASAEVYKWVDDKGVVHYTDKPVEQNAVPAKLPPLQTFDGGNIPKLTPSTSTAPTAASSAAAATLTVRIVSPEDEETIRDAQRTVPVAVAVTGDTEGLRYVYYLDGTANALPSSSTTHILTGVERGAHTIGVSVIDEAGAEVGVAKTVTINMKPPSAK